MNIIQQKHEKEKKKVSSNLLDTRYHPTTKVMGFLARSTYNSDCTIKGNISSSGEKIYHMPTGVYYNKTKEEEIFCTKEEAEAAGYRASKR